MSFSGYCWCHRAEFSGRVVLPEFGRLGSNHRYSFEGHLVVRVGHLTVGIADTLVGRNVRVRTFNDSTGITDSLSIHAVRSAALSDAGHL